MVTPVKKLHAAEIFVLALLLLLLVHGIYDTWSFAAAHIPLTNDNKIALAKLGFNQLVKVVAIFLLWKQHKWGWRIIMGIYLFVIAEGAIIITSALPERSKGLLITLFAMLVSALVLALIQLPAIRKKYYIQVRDYLWGVLCAAVILAIFHYQP